MDKHGIGTDASMAQHISNVLKRGYIKLDEKSRQLVPTGVGLALSHAFTLVDPALVQPPVRSSIENACNRVAKGEMRKADVISKAVSTFEVKFKHFCERVDRVPAMLSVAYKRGTPSADAQWESAAKATAAVSLDELLRNRASVELGVESNDANQNLALGPGVLVHIHGLKGAAHLNGQQGFCDHLDPDTGRWHVRLPGGDTKALKPENLRPLAKNKTELKPGSLVRLVGLVNAPQLNGSSGTCESFDPESGRWYVRLQSGGVPRALKAENLRPLADESSGKDAPKRSQPDEPCDRNSLKKRAFILCDKDGDGFLNKDEMLPIGKLSGFEGSADKWRVEYMKYCVGSMSSTAKGIPEKSVLQLLDDISEDGCYCSDEQLVSFLKGAWDNSPKKKW